MYLTTKNTLSKIILPKQKDKNGDCMVYIQILSYTIYSYQKPIKKYKRIPTGIRVTPSQWSKSKQEVMKSDFDAGPKNFQINLLWNRINQYCNDLENAEYRQSVEDEFETLVGFFPSPQQKAKSNVITYFNEYIALRKTTAERGTYKEFITCRNRLSRFLEENSLQGMQFEEITLSFSDNFHVWLTEKGYHQNTIQKTFAVLRTFLNHYYERREELGLKLSEKFRSRNFIKARKTASEPKPLNDEELNSLKNAILPVKLDRARDRFLLQISTGLRHSDVHRITQKDVINDVLSISPQKTHNVKTNNQIYIPLNNLSKKILEKYNYDTSALKISNQKYNKHLKELCQLLRFDEAYTSHNGRDTFITKCVKAGIDIPTIMSWTGHEKYDMLKKYINLSNEHKVRMMKKVKF